MGCKLRKHLLSRKASSDKASDCNAFGIVIKYYTAYSIQEPVCFVALKHDLWEGQGEGKVKKIWR
jgi:hypothetical protein